MSKNDWNHENGSYAIQEQGDLGLGLTGIDKKYIDKDGNISIPKEEDDKKSSNGFKRIPF